MSKFSLIQPKEIISNFKVTNQEEIIIIHPYLIPKCKNYITLGAFRAYVTADEGNRILRKEIYLISLN
jgi:hypothetical protein